MDLPLYVRVLRRFWPLVGLGIILAVGLSVFSVARVGGKPFISYRKPAVYVSYARLFVTQPGFPWGSLNPPATANPDRFTSLAILYAQLATSDPVRRIMLEHGPLEGHGSTQVAPLLDSSNQQPLPIISIAGFADSPAAAVRVARRQTDALMTYLHQQQASSDISAVDRVDVALVQRAVDAKLFKGRKMTLAIVVFLATLVITCGLAFSLENLRPMPRAAEEQKPLKSMASDAA